MYNLTLQFNGETFKKKSKRETLKRTILSFRPDVLYTEMYVTLKDKQDVRERKLTLVQGKNLFNNEDFLDVFIINLLLK